MGGLLSALFSGNAKAKDDSGIDPYLNTGLIGHLLHLPADKSSSAYARAQSIAMEKERLGMAKDENQRQAAAAVDAHTHFQSQMDNLALQKVDLERQAAITNVLNTILPPDQAAMLQKQMGIDEASNKHDIARFQKNKADLQDKYGEKEVMLGLAQTQAQIAAAGASAAASNESRLRSVEGRARDTREENRAIGTATLGNVFKNPDLFANDPFVNPSDVQQMRTLTAQGVPMDQWPKALKDQAFLAGANAPSLEQNSPENKARLKQLEGQATEADARGKTLERAYTEDNSAETHIKGMLKEYTDLAVSPNAAKDPLVAARMADIKKKLTPILLGAQDSQSTAPDDAAKADWNNLGTDKGSILGNLMAGVGTVVATPALAVSAIKRGVDKYKKPLFPSAEDAQSRLQSNEYPDMGPLAKDILLGGFNTPNIATAGMLSMGGKSAVPKPVKTSGPSDADIEFSMQDLGAWLSGKKAPAASKITGNPPGIYTPPPKPGPSGSAPGVVGQTPSPWAKSGATSPFINTQPIPEPPSTPTFQTPTGAAPGIVGMQSEPFGYPTQSSPFLPGTGIRSVPPAPIKGGVPGIVGQSPAIFGQSQSQSAPGIYGGPSAQNIGLGNVPLSPGETTDAVRRLAWFLSNGGKL